MLTIISQAELLFMLEEVRQLQVEIYKLDAAPSDLAERLANYSEGWITAIILAFTAINQGDQTASFKFEEIKISNSGSYHSLESALNKSNNANQIFDYLAQEVFAVQPPEIQDFLLKTSVFALLNPEECESLLILSGERKSERNSNSSISEAILQQLESRNLFITQLRSELTGEGYYQYHALFRQFLLSRLKQKSEEYVFVQLKAAEVVRKNGNLVEAIQHFIEAGAIEQAAKMLSEVADEMYQSGLYKLLSNLLSKIPLERQKISPQLLNVQAQLLLETGDNENSRQAYEDAATLFLKEGLVDSAARAMANQAQLLARMGKRPKAYELCMVLLQDYSTLMLSTTGQQAIALSKTMLGSMATEEGNSSEAEKNLVEAREIYSSTRDEFHLAMVNSYFGRLYHYEGRLVRSNIFYERALSFFVKSGNRLREVYSRLGLAGNLYLQVQYQLAEKQLNEVLTLSENLTDRYLQIYVLAYLGDIYRDTEHFKKADETYAEALQLARSVPDPQMELWVLSN